jgi:hypothetical protein
MRSWSLAAVMVLLAGCSGGAPSAAPTTGPVDEPVPAPVVVFGTAAYDGWDALGETTVRGQRAEVWDAGASLGLPRPFTALLVEMRCSGSVQEGDNQHPQLLATATFDNATGNPFEASGGGNSDCDPVSFDLTGELVGGIGSLKSLSADAPLGNQYTLGADLRIEYAASLFTEGPIPAGYTAFTGPMA